MLCCLVFHEALFFLFLGGKSKMSDKIEIEKGTVVSTSAGAVAGAVSGVAGVLSGGAAGTTGAAALTSGLATVGSVVGGGMLAGIGVVAAAPIAGSAACFGIYKAFKKLNS